MIPKVAKSGRSFKGAALYYLLDKENTSDRFNRNADAKSAWQGLINGELGDRVAYTETHNLPTNDPARAINHMIDTAAHEAEIKMAAGNPLAKTKAKPVYAYSLSWDQSDNPSMEDQIQAARDTIKELGLDDYQTLIVAHNDTDHPHVHVIINRIHPETGMAAKHSKDFVKLSEWALEYQRERGQTHCPEREKNANERDQGNWVKHTAESRQERNEWKKATTAKLWNEFRAEKKAVHDKRKPQYDALWQQRENRLNVRKAELKAYHKPLWADIFKRQRQEMQDFDASLLKRIAYAMSNASGNTFGILSAITKSGKLRGQLIKQHEADRAELSAVQKLRINDATREVHKAWQFDRDQLKDMHKQRDEDLYSVTKSKSDDIWKSEPSNEFEAVSEPQKARQGKKRNIFKRTKKTRDKGRSRSRPRPR